LKEKLVVDHETLPAGVAAGRGKTHGAGAQAKAPAMAGTQAELWGRWCNLNGSQHELFEGGPQVRADGDGG